MKTRHTFIFLMALFAVISAKAQDSISVESFQLLPNDMDASLLGTMRIDQNGRTAALIKIETSQTGFSFNVDTLDIIDSQQKPDGIWLWMPFDVKHITIRHSEIGQHLDYYFPIKIEEAKTYEMKLTSRFVSPLPHNDIEGSYLIMTVEPKDAQVFIDDQQKSAENGEVMILLPYGMHSYRVEAPSHIIEAGTFRIGKNRKELNVRLISTKATLTVNCPDSDAEIYVNGQKQGLGSWTGQLDDGVYLIEARKEGHRSIKQELTLAKKEQKILKLNPPQPIFGKLNLNSSPSNCEVFIDGLYIGKSPDIFTNILIGKHTVNLHKEGYSTYSDTLEIKENCTAELYATLSNTTTVRFTCNVPNAILYVDDSIFGSASGDYVLSNEIHHIRASAENYDDYIDSISVSSENIAFKISMNAMSGSPLTFTANGVTFKMLPVAGDTFNMGTISEQGDNSNDGKKLAHSVTLSSFYMGQTEVTQALWEAVMGNRPIYNDGWTDEYGKGNDFPAYRVSWEECQIFIEKLNALLFSQTKGMRFALPTEAEWEFAARGGKHSHGYRYSGSNNINEVAWYNNNSGKTHEVATKSPNELGLYDMSGNVCEWCSDWYGYYSSNCQTDPKGPSSGFFRISRGGDWNRSAWYCRVSYRNYYAPDFRFINTGLRLLLR